MANIGNLVIRLMGDNSQLTDTLHKSAKEIEKYKKAISGREKDVNTIFDYHTEGARGALSAVTGTFSAIGSVAGGLKDIFQTLNPLEMFTPSLDQLKAISITALGIVGSYAIKTAVEFEQTRISFEVLTGSVEKGMGLLNTIQNFAMQTPYQMGELQQVGKQLLAFGIDVNQIVPTLSMLGDIAKPLQQDLAGIAHIYGQIREQGQLSGHTLRELTMRAVPISTSLSAVTGIDKQDIKKATELGQITFTDVQKAFLMMTSAGGQFYQMNDRLSKSTLGNWQAFLDNIILAARPLGDMLIQELKINETLEWGTRILKDSGKYWDDVRYAIQEAYKWSDAIVNTLWQAIKGTVGVIGAMIQDWSGNSTYDDFVSVRDVMDQISVSLEEATDYGDSLAQIFADMATDLDNLGGLIANALIVPIKQVVSMVLSIPLAVNDAVKALGGKGNDTLNDIDKWTDHRSFNDEWVAPDYHKRRADQRETARGDRDYKSNTGGDLDGDFGSHLKDGPKFGPDGRMIVDKITIDPSIPLAFRNLGEETIKGMKEGFPDIRTNLMNIKGAFKNNLFIDSTNRTSLDPSELNDDDIETNKAGFGYALMEQAKKLKSLYGIDNKPKFTSADQATFGTSEELAIRTNFENGNSGDPVQDIKKILGESAKIQEEQRALLVKIAEAFQDDDDPFK